jgi:pimeloyl-ACP methyl ester carboxylesterase
LRGPIIPQPDCAGNCSEAVKPSRSRFLPVRGLRCHLREWGAPGAPLLLLLHGWMDVSASFQFVVDEFARDWHVLAPDWRGFGLSERGPGDCYWFADYLGDLDAILDAVSADAPALLVGHSMGGNVALLYAGVRPSRVRAVVNLEGFGLKDCAPALAPGRYARWLDELKSPPGARRYAARADIAARLQRNNPRLDAARAAFLAEHWGRRRDDGGYEVAGDPAHKIVNPVLYRWAEVAACWQAIECPVLWVEAAQTDAHRWAGDGDEIARRVAELPRVEVARVEDAGHMLHHDQPQAVARLIEDFAGRAPATS